MLTSPFSTPLQLPQTLNLDARHYHSTPGPLQQSNFYFEKSYLSHPIPCLPNFFQILDPKETPIGFLKPALPPQTQHTPGIKSGQRNMRRMRFLLAHTSKRSLNFLGKTCLTEPRTELPQLEWSETMRPQSYKTIRKIVSAYDICGAPTIQQQPALLNGIVTYLYMYPDPVSVMA